MKNAIMLKQSENLNLTEKSLWNYLKTLSKRIFKVECLS